MHPILSSRARLGVYFLAWVPAVVFLMSQFAVVGWGLWSGLVISTVGGLLASLLFLSCWPLCRVLPLKGTPAATFLGTWIAAAILMGTVWAWAMDHLCGIVVRTLGIPLPAEPPRAAWLSLIGMGAIFYLVTVAYHYLLDAQERAREAEATQKELRDLAREAELKALRAQLNPHFLFNSLNSISALTTLDPKGARHMCVLLSDFLRKSLRLGERPLVSLAEELDLMRAYLAIEQIRFGERLQVEWNVEDGVEAAEIPTLLLQPLVENAIKHGVANLSEGGTVRIRARRLDSLVEIHLENARDPEGEAPLGLGLGLAQVRRRLRARHGAAATFEAAPGEGTYLVRMRFPFLAYEEAPHE